MNRKLHVKPGTRLEDTITRNQDISILICYQDIILISMVSKITKNMQGYDIIKNKTNR